MNFKREDQSSDGYSKLSNKVFTALKDNQVPGTKFVIIRGGEHGEMLALADALASQVSPSSRAVWVGDGGTLSDSGYLFPADAQFDYEAVSEIEEAAEPFEHLTYEKLGMSANLRGYFYDMGSFNDEHMEQDHNGYDFLTRGTRAEVVVFDGFAEKMPTLEPLMFHRTIDPRIEKEGGFLANDHNVKLVVWIQTADRMEKEPSAFDYVTGAITFYTDEIGFNTWVASNKKYSGLYTGEVISHMPDFHTVQFHSPSEYESIKRPLASEYLLSLEAQEYGDRVIAVISPNVDRALEFAASMFAGSGGTTMITGTNETHGSRIIAEMSDIEFQYAESLYDEDGKADYAGMLSDQDHIFDLTSPYSHVSAELEFSPALGNRAIALVARSIEELQGSIIWGDLEDTDIFNYLDGLVEVTGSGLRLYRR